jgi:hypothetical protein
MDESYFDLIRFRSGFVLRNFKEVGGDLEKIELPYCSCGSFVWSSSKHNFLGHQCVTRRASFKPISELDEIAKNYTNWQSLF